MNQHKEDHFEVLRKIQKKPDLTQRKLAKGEKIVKEGIEGELIDLEDDAAEMSLQEKSTIGHRGKAMQKLITHFL